MALSIEYEVGEAGWATCRVSLGTDTTVEMAASYLHDSLGQLCDTVLRIVSGAVAGVVVFMDEPGEHHLQITRSGGDVEIQVVWHEDWVSQGDATRENGRTVLWGRVPLQQLHQQTCAAVGHVLHSLGPDEYKRRWMLNEFPRGDYERLTVAKLTV